MSARGIRLGGLRMRGGGITGMVCQQRRGRVLSRRAGSLLKIVIAWAD